MNIFNILFITVIVSLFQHGLSDTLTYENARAIAINTESLISTGGKIILNPLEDKVNNILMKYKANELMAGFNDPKLLTTSLHFFKGKELIEKSKVFEIIKLMPKGALLHVHNTASVSSDWIIKTITYYPNIMTCTKDNITIFTFSKNTKDCSDYKMISDERKRAPNVKEFDNQLDKLINLYTPTPEIDYPAENMIWSIFQTKFKVVDNIIRYLPAFKAYHKRLLEESYNDGIMYIELRSGFKTAFDDAGKEYTALEVAIILKNLVNEFKAANPGFFGVKLIYTAPRILSPDDMKKEIDVFKVLFEKLPGFLIGFDIVGQEDTGKPLHNYREILELLPTAAKTFFHAGETNWFGTSVDYNLVDAILMNATRIGHGYAAMKHPVIWNSLKQNNIPLEICPLSNQILHLVEDLRSHPASSIIANDVPFVISSDDPSFWGAKGLSYDFYYAFMSLASNTANLKFLKQITFNSIQYSVLTEAERKQAIVLLENKWNQFLNDVLKKIK